MTRSGHVLPVGGPPGSNAERGTPRDAPGRAGGGSWIEVRMEPARGGTICVGTL